MIGDNNIVDASVGESSLFDCLSSILRVAEVEFGQTQPAIKAAISAVLSKLKHLLPTVDLIGYWEFDAAQSNYRQALTVPESHSEGISTVSFGLIERSGHALPKMIDQSELKSAEYASLCNSIPSVVAQVIIAPVTYNEHYGFILLGLQANKCFPGGLVRFIGFVCDLLGLCQYTIAEKTQLREIHQQQTQAFMDFEHQIRAPLRHFAWRISKVLQLARALDHSDISARVSKEIEYLRGINRRAQRIAANLQLYSSLAANRPPEANISSYAISTIVGWLVASAMDQQLLCESEMGIKFEVNREKLEAVPRYMKIKVDQHLVVQAVDDLLDNAAKYSHGGTTVRIDLSITKKSFVIAVVNEGLKINRSETELMAERGYRGPLAQHLTGEGSGIGLWLVREIMKAHNGRLEIEPTDPKGCNFIRMIFPLS